MSDSKEFGVTAGGVPLLGAAGTFTAIARTKPGAVRAPPLIIEVGGGSYRIVPTADDEQTGVVVHIDCGAGRLPRRVTIPVFLPDNSNQLWAFHIENPDGTAWAGAAGTVGSYRSGAGARTPPALVPADGAYLFTATPTAADVAADTEIRIDGPAGSAQPFWFGSTLPIVVASGSGLDWSVTVTPSAAVSDVPGVASGIAALRDKALDPVTGDLLQVENDQAWLSGSAAIASDLASRLQTFAGEWDQDTGIGFPWLQEVLGKKPREAKVRMLLTKEILACPGCVSISRMTIALGGDRKLSASVDVVDDFGNMISATLASIAKGV